MKALIGIAVAVAGGVLALFFWNLEFFWFQGGPLGLVLIVLGALEFWESRRRRTDDRPKGILQELRDDILGPPRREPPARRSGDQGDEQ